MEYGILVLAAVLVILGGGAAYGVLRLRNSVRNISRMAFGTDSLIKGLEQQEVLLAETPKTVAGMTSLCLPRIQRDFPEFHWPEWRQRCETILKSYLQALDQQNLSCLRGDSEELKKQVELELERQEQMEKPLSYEQVKVHQTEISRYQKDSGMRTIVIQSAVEYKSRYEARKTQTRFNMELVYIQDITKIKEAVTAVGPVCPNCGAPVTGLGSKVCDYCGGAVEPVNERVWKLHRIEEEGD